MIVIAPHIGAVLDRLQLTQGHHKAASREAVPAAEILLIRAFPDSISYCILSHSVREIRVREESKS